MDRFVRWFWETFREHFFLAVFVLATILVGLGVLAPIGILFTHVWRLQAGEGAIFAFVVFLMLIFAATVGAYRSRASRLAITAWAMGDRSDPQGARDAALVMGQQTASAGVRFGLIPTVAVCAPVINRYAHMEWRGFVIICLMLVAAGFIVQYLVGVGTTLFVRPMLEEITEHTALDAPTVRAWSLQRRLFSGVVATGFVTGLGTGGVAYLFSSSLETAFVATFITSGLMALYCTMLYQVGVISPTLQPLRDLERAITRVRSGDFNQRLPVYTADQFGDVATAFNEMMDGLQQRHALQAAFGSYVDPSLAQRLVDQGSSVFDGEAVKATIFFADVRGFTTYADQVTPEKAVARLNRLFDILVPAIRDCGGHANRYTGDGVLAVFGTPEPLINHAEQAVTAAQRIQREIRDAFGEGLRMGIGINTGRVIAGTIGGGGKLDFTVIGDAVNIAARVEEMTKDTGDCILLTQATVDACISPPADLCDRGQRPVRGKATSVQVYALG